MEHEITALHRAADETTACRWLKPVTLPVLTLRFFLDLLDS